MRWVVIFVSLIALVACQDVSETNPDSAAKTGCRHYNNVALDARDGVLSNAQIVIKVREVYDDLKLSEVPRLREKARDVVNDASRGDASSFGKSSAVLASTCRTILDNS